MKLMWKLMKSWNWAGIKPATPGYRSWTFLFFALRPVLDHYISDDSSFINSSGVNFYVKATLYSHWWLAMHDSWERIRVQYCPDVESVFGLWAILYSYLLVWSCDCRERIRVQYCSDVEIVFLPSNSFNDIGAHQDFEMPEFFMPQLLIKELCIRWSNIGFW